MEATILTKENANENPIFFFEVSTDTKTIVGKIIMQLFRNAPSFEKYFNLLKSKNYVGRLISDFIYKGERSIMEMSDSVDDTKGVLISGDKNEFYICDTKPKKDAETFGKVVRGYGFIEDAATALLEKSRIKFVVVDCGQIRTGLNDDSMTSDPYPDHPSDLPTEWNVRQNLRNIVDIIAEIKNYGNDHYRSGRYDLAKDKYRKVFTYIRYLRDSVGTTNEKEEDYIRQKVEIPCYLNVAAVMIRERNWKAVIKECDKVLSVDDRNVKALFRRGVATMKIGNFNDSKRNFDIARSLSATKEIDRQIEKLKLEKKLDLLREKDLYRKMLK